MSNENLLEWFEKFMFGASDLSRVPSELYLLIARMETEGVEVEDILSNGGFVNLSKSTNRDLQRMVRYVCEGGEDPYFETPTIASFFNSLSYASGKNLRGALVKRSGPEPEATPSDWEILASILKNLDGDRTFEYSSAGFWGELARRLLHLERPFNMTEIETTPMFLDVIRVYDHTCKTLGREIDPFSLAMVPRESHVDPVHWRTPEAFRQFLKSDHPLAAAVQSFVTDSILEARYQDLPDDWQLRTFLKNVRKVHRVVSSVEGPDVPPTLIDVFQRLLAEANRDILWEREQIDRVHDPPVREHLSLYLRVLELERAASNSLID